MPPFTRQNVARSRHAAPFRSSRIAGQGLMVGCQRLETPLAGFALRLANLAVKRRRLVVKPAIFAAMPWASAATPRHLGNRAGCSRCEIPKPVILSAAPVCFETGTE